MHVHSAIVFLLEFYFLTCVTSPICWGRSMGIFIYHTCVDFVIGVVASQIYTEIMQSEIHAYLSRRNGLRNSFF